jgi:hypothetical protein
MTYYEQKALNIREHCLSHPWREEEQRTLVVMLKEIARDQRHACGEALYDDDDFVDAAIAHIAVTNAEIGE